MTGLVCDGAKQLKENQKTLETGGYSGRSKKTRRRENKEEWMGGHPKNYQIRG
jgi:hypothetical protein